MILFYISLHVQLTTMTDPNRGNGVNTPLLNYVLVDIKVLPTLLKKNKYSIGYNINY